MVSQLYAQELSTLLKPLCDGNIFGAWRRVAGGMVVGEDDGRGIGQDGRFEDLPWVDNAGREAPDAADIDGCGLAFDIQAQHKHGLTVHIREEFRDNPGCVFWAGDFPALVFDTSFPDKLQTDNIYPF